MKRFILSAVVMVSLVGLARASSASEFSRHATAKASGNNQTAPSGNNGTPTGEDVFNEHCARCHVPPTAIHPRITGTVVMHMRTRARLSSRDQQLLLKYLAP